MLEEYVLGKLKIYRLANKIVKDKTVRYTIFFFHIAWKTAV
ncbi:hypothetical protein HMPREF9141_1860 [Prevotella multiformis DSM 16608]|uniref:Uncharacterized protein n=1 Tax=Prevotella multiformis DSM 16608 TaxID=888743 RepID=F0F8E3_9BACT|nr:hypothetical protein HMPREF9141_1860 [Prevotella multiformis DSM 16608]